MSVAVVLCGQRSESYSTTILDVDSERSSKGISMVLLYGWARLIACRWYLVVSEKLLYVKLSATTVVACMGVLWALRYTIWIYWLFGLETLATLQAEHENAASVGGLSPSRTNLIS